MKSALIKIDDKIKNIQTELEYKFKSISKYRFLLNSLPHIYPEFSNVACHIAIWYTYNGEKIRINDLNKYILNRDIIELEIYPLRKTYFLYNIMEQKKLIKSLNNMPDLYRFYNTQLMNNIDCEVLLCSRIR